MAALRDSFFRSLPEPLQKRLVDAGADSVILPAQHPEVGDLEVSFDDEITVCLGRHTHLHFSPWNSASEDREQGSLEAARQAAEFIVGIIEDRWVIWSVPGGPGGCFTDGADSVRTSPSPRRRTDGRVHYDRAAHPAVAPATLAGHR